MQSLTDCLVIILLLRLVYFILQLDIYMFAGVKPVSFSQWEAIDKEEITRGTAEKKIREKIVDLDEMLHVAGH